MKPKEISKNKNPLHQEKEEPKNLPMKGFKLYCGGLIPEVKK